MKAQGQLVLEADSLVGNSWWAEKHGRCEVIEAGWPWPNWYRIQVRALGGHRRFQMAWPENVVRGELPDPAAVWVGNNSQGFVNQTEHLRLANLGLVDLDPAIANAASAVTPSAVKRRSESPIVAAQTEGAVMAVAIPKKPARPKKGGGLMSLSKTALRKKLLETVTIPDGAWATYRKEHDLPDRDAGETREAFIKRVLA